jgi:hypothetical protein
MLKRLAGLPNVIAGEPALLGVLQQGSRVHDGDCPFAPHACHEFWRGGISGDVESSAEDAH